MIGFTSISQHVDADEQAASKQSRNELIAIAVMAMVLALAIGVRLWIYLPQPWQS